jgi:hypothetical protein
MGKERKDAARELSKYRGNLEILEDRFDGRPISGVGVKEFFLVLAPSRL